MIIFVYKSFIILFKENIMWQDFNGGCKYKKCYKKSL